jgi:hypothetical protein
MPTERDIETIQSLFQRLRALKALRRAHERGQASIRITAHFSSPEHALDIPLTPELHVLAHTQISQAIEATAGKLHAFGFAEEQQVFNKVKRWAQTADDTIVIYCTNGAEMVEPLRKHPDLDGVALQNGCIVDDGAAIQWRTADGHFYKIAVPQPVEPAEKH